MTAHHFPTRLGSAVLGLAVLTAVAVAQGIDPEVRRTLKGILVDPTPAPAWIPTRNILVRLNGGDAVLMGRGRIVRRLVDPRWVVVETRSLAAAAEAVQVLRGSPGVVGAWNDAITLATPDGFAPNDPYFYPNAPTAGWPGQWYLANSATPGLDLGVAGAWARDLTGQGVTVGIVDDGFETGHPDLAPNFSATDSYDFYRRQPDPNPFYSNDFHGIAVAGIVGGRGGNGVGISGAAPGVNLAGLRLDFRGRGTVSQTVEATLYRSSGATTTIAIKNHSYGYSSAYVEASALAGAMVESAGFGTIHVRSAGNTRGGSGEDANKHAERNLPEVITVSGLTNLGRYASYSNFGACVTVCSPTGGLANGLLDQITTDRMTEQFGYNGGNDAFPDASYTSIFGGTSGAAPGVSGVLALAKQTQPALNSRWAKHLLALTSQIVDPYDASTTSDGGWQTNAAGYRFSQNYGFGLANADRLTDWATRFTGLTPLGTESTGVIRVDTNIPDNALTGLTRTFTIQSSEPLEEVQIALDIAHSYRGDLEAYLTSPSGTTGRLILRSLDSGDNILWTFMSHAFWGENPSGTWTLRVRDVAAPDAGRWNSFSATVRPGRLEPAAGRIDADITLAGFAGPREQIFATIEVRNPGTLVAVEQRSLTLESSGTLRVFTARRGIFDIAVKTPTGLRRRVSGILLGPGAVPITVALDNGDIDDDNDVDHRDMDLLIASFGLGTGQPGADPRTDVDGNGLVDSDDFDIVVQAYGRTGDP